MTILTDEASVKLNSVKLNSDDTWYAIADDGTVTPYQDSSELDRDKRYLLFASAKTYQMLRDL